MVQILMRVGPCMLIAIGNTKIFPSNIIAFENNIVNMIVVIMWFIE